MRKLKGLDEMTEMIQKRTAKHDKQFESVKWRIDKIDMKTSEMSIMQPSASAQSIPDTVDATNPSEKLEAMAASGDGEQARLMNRILTYLRKIEMRLDDKVDKMDNDDEFENIRKLIEENFGLKANINLGTTPSIMNNSGSGQFSEARMMNLEKKLIELEKLVCG